MSEMDSPRVCPLCSMIAQRGAAFCSQCGAPLTARTPSTPSGRTKWYYNIWVVLALLFLVAGPFALPLVWKHPRFARWLKVLLTVLTAVYTLLLIKTTLVMIQVVTQQLNQFNATLQRW